MPSTSSQKLPWHVLQDPRVFMRTLWPHMKLYSKQWEIIESVCDNYETVVPSGNKLGKDFVAARIVLWFFLTRHPCRIVTTSAKDDHLKVLWGEVGQAISNCRYALDVKRGGPLIINHHELKKCLVPGNPASKCPLSYAVGMVASVDSEAALQGHHATPTLEDYLNRGLLEDYRKAKGEGAKLEDGIDWTLPRTLFVVDEASSVPDRYLPMAKTWAKRLFIFGNPWPCSNFFYRAVEGTPGTEDTGGDILRDTSVPKPTSKEINDEAKADDRSGSEGSQLGVDRGAVASAGQPTAVGTVQRPGDSGRVADGAGGNDQPDRSSEGEGVGRGSVRQPGRRRIPLARTKPKYLRKVIHISADDSPNVRLARAELRAGREPSRRLLVPGVLDWDEYCDKERTYDEHQKCVSLGGKFYKGKEVYLYPALWLDRAERLGDERAALRRTGVRAIGIDPGENQANTALAVGDELGLLELVSYKPANDWENERWTTIVVEHVLNFARKWGVAWTNVCFDRGGGGKQIADILRSRGYPVRTVGFGESVKLEPKRGLRMMEERKEVLEDQYAYTKRRAELFGELACMLDPGFVGAELGDTKVKVQGFAIPRMYSRVLRSQMQLIPKLYDAEGQLYIPPKHRKPGEEVNEKKKTLIEIVGHSPDELDALVLMCHGLLHKNRQAVARAI